MVAELDRQPTDEYLSIHGLRIHLQRRGPREAPPVVLIHGGCANLHWWDHFAASLAADFHVVAVDLRGHGDSAHSVPPAYSITDYGDDLSAILACLAIENAAFVGHSLGAVIVSKLAVDEPDRVRRLVLVDSQAKLSSASVRYLAKLRYFPKAVYKSYEQAVERFRLLPKQSSATPEMLRQIAGASIGPNGDGTWSPKFDRDTLSQLEPIDLIPQLGKLARPILFVRGEHSAVLPRDRQLALLAQIPTARAAEIAGAHHHVMLDNPDEFDRVVGRYLME